MVTAQEIQENKPPLSSERSAPEGHGATAGGTAMSMGGAVGFINSISQPFARLQPGPYFGDR